MRDSNGHDRGSILSLGILFLVLGGMKVAPPPTSGKISHGCGDVSDPEGGGGQALRAKKGREDIYRGGDLREGGVDDDDAGAAPGEVHGEGEPRRPPAHHRRPIRVPREEAPAGDGGGGKYEGKAPSGSRKPTGPWGRRQASQRHPEASGVGAGGDPTAAASAERTRGAPRSGTPPPPALTRAPVAHKKGEGRTAGSLLGGCQRSFGRPR